MHPIISVPQPGGQVHQALGRGIVPSSPAVSRLGAAQEGHMDFDGKLVLDVLFPAVRIGLISKYTGSTPASSPLPTMRRCKNIASVFLPCGVPWRDLP